MDTLQSTIPNPQSPIPCDLYCPDCAYDLRELTSSRCPECGQSLEQIRTTVPQLPWAHRKQLGRFLAYWRTVHLVMFHPRRFCSEMARPVSYSDAQRFRWLSILHIYLPILVVTALAYYAAPPGSIRFENSYQTSGGLIGVLDANTLKRVYTEAWPIVVLHVCLLLFLAAATGAVSYFFHPRDLPVPMQNRAIALSYYTTAALAWTWIPLALGVAAYQVMSIHEVLGVALNIFAFALLVIAVLACWTNTVQVLRGTMPRHKVRAWVLGITLPALWAVLAVVIFVGLGAVVLSVLVVLASLG